MNKWGAEETIHHAALYCYTNRTACHTVNSSSSSTSAGLSVLVGLAHIVQSHEGKDNVAETDTVQRIATVSVWQSFTSFNKLQQQQQHTYERESRRKIEKKKAELTVQIRNR